MPPLQRTAPATRKDGDVAQPPRRAPACGVSWHLLDTPRWLTSSLVAWSLVGCSPAVPPPVDPARTVKLEWIARFDRDHDGSLSREEWSWFGGTPRLLRAFDFDGDGRLDANECLTLYDNINPHERTR